MTTGDTWTESFEASEIVVVKSQKQPGMVLGIPSDMDDPSGTLAVPVVVRHPSGRYALAKMRMHDSFDGVEFSSNITDDLFDSFDDACQYALDLFDEEAA